jgi:hypothetical protein
MKKFVLGALAAYGLIVGVGFGSIILGLLPVQADIVPSRLEARLLGAALRASVVRHAPKSNTPPASEESLIAGPKSTVNCVPGATECRKNRPVSTATRFIRRCRLC